MSVQGSPRNEKPKRIKTRNRSPMQGLRRNQHVTKKSPPGLVRSPAMHDGFRGDDWERASTEDTTHATGVATSDESSSGVCGDVQAQAQSQTSPRKVRKIRDTNRRKSTPRSPTNTRTKRRNGSGDDKPSSLPGSLPRRRAKQESEDNCNTLSAKSNRLSPYRYLLLPVVAHMCLIFTLLMQESWWFSEQEKKFKSCKSRISPPESIKCRITTVC